MFPMIGGSRDLSVSTWMDIPENCLGRGSVGIVNTLKYPRRIKRNGFIWISMVRWRMPKCGLMGIKWAKWAFGYSSFRVDLTPYLLYDKKNVIAVRLNTEKFGSRWYPGAGIYRHVRLVKTNPVHVGQWGVFVTTPEITDEQANALVRVEIQNNLSEAVDGQYMVDIYELDKDDVPGAKVAVGLKKQLLLKPNQLTGDTVSLLVNSPNDGVWRILTAIWPVCRFIIKTNWWMCMMHHWFPDYSVHA